MITFVGISMTEKVTAKTVSECDVQCIIYGKRICDAKSNSVCDVESTVCTSSSRQKLLTNSPLSVIFHMLFTHSANREHLSCTWFWLPVNNAAYTLGQDVFVSSFRHTVTQAGLEVTTGLCLCLLSSGVISVSHHNHLWRSIFM